MLFCESVNQNLPTKIDKPPLAKPTSLIPTYLTDNFDNETIKETIFYLGNLANLSTFEHLLMVHTGKVKEVEKA